MTPQKHTMSVLAQITSWIPDRIIENLAAKFKVQTRAFSATSHVIAMVYAHLAHALSLNDICDSLSNHAGTLAQIRNCTPPSRNGLSHANMTRNAGMAEELFWKVQESLAKKYPGFLNPESVKWHLLSHNFVISRSHRLLCSLESPHSDSKSTNFTELGERSALSSETARKRQGAIPMSICCHEHVLCDGIFSWAGYPSMYSGSDWLFCVGSIFRNHSRPINQKK